ncbi:hypothetical protein DMENIID0001_067550 [Sergentomyia squamirostris]
MDDQASPLEGGSAGKKRKTDTEGNNYLSDEDTEMIETPESVKIIPQKDLLINNIVKSSMNKENSVTHHEASVDKDTSTDANKGAEGTSTNTTSQAEEKAQYSRRDHGPYAVIFTYDETQWNDIKLGKLLKEKNRRFESVTKINRKKSRVIFHTASDANNATIMSMLKDKNLTAEIPRNFAEKWGVIYDVDMDMTDDEIAKAINSTIEVKGVERMKKFVAKVDGKNTYVPTATIKVRFLGDALPKTVRIYGACRRVKNLRVTVMQCFKCFKFGHKTLVCKKEKEICKKCAEDILLDREEHKCERKKCANCESDQHDAIDKNCSVYSAQKSIKILAQTKRITITEATRQMKEEQESYFTPDPNLAPAPDRHDITVFPNLRQPRPRPRIDTAELQRSAINQQAVWNSYSMNPKIPSKPMDNNPHKASDMEKLQFFLSEISRITTLWGFSLVDNNQSAKPVLACSNAGDSNRKVTSDMSDPTQT